MRGGSTASRRLAVRSRRGRGRVPRRLGAHARGRRAAASLGLGDEARDRGRGARRRRGGNRLARRSGRPARLDASPPARPRLGSAVRRRRADRASRVRGGSTRTPGIELAAEHVAQAAGMPFAEYFEAVWGFPLDGSPAHGDRGCRSRRSSRWRASSGSRRGSRARRSPRRRPSSSPGSTASCPASAGSSRTTGASAPSFETPSTRTGRAPATRARTFGHFGGGGGFLWVDPDAGVALACLTDLEFGDWALEAWPRLSDAVLERV